MRRNGAEILDRRENIAKKDRLFIRNPNQFIPNPLVLVVTKVAKERTLSAYEIIEDVNWDPIKQKLGTSQ